MTSLSSIREKYWEDLREELSIMEFGRRKLTAKQLTKAIKIMGPDFKKFQALVKSKVIEPLDYSRYMDEEEIIGEVPELSWRASAIHYLHDKYPQYGQELLDMAAGQFVEYEKVKKIFNVIGKEVMYLFGKWPPKHIRSYTHEY